MKRSGIVVPFAGMLLALLGSCGSGPNYQLPEKPPPAQPPPIAQQTGSVTVTPQYAAMQPGQSMRFTALSSLDGAVEWMVNSIPGGNSSVGLIDAKGNYTAPLTSSATNAVISAVLATSPANNFATAVVAVIQAGQLTPTPNPQVAAYSIYLPAPGNVSVQFGTENRITSQQATPSPDARIWLQAHPTQPAKRSRAVRVPGAIPNQIRGKCAGQGQCGKEKQVHSTRARYRACRQQDWRSRYRDAELLGEHPEWQAYVAIAYEIA